MLNQKELEAAVVHFGSSFTQELSEIKVSMNSMKEQLLQETRKEIFEADIMKRLDEIQVEIGDFEKTFSRHRNDFIELMKQEVEHLIISQNASDNGLVKELGDRAVESAEQHQQLKTFLEGFLNEVKAIQLEGENLQSVARQSLQAAADSLHGRLEESLKEERQWVGQEMEKTQSSMLQLTNMMGVLQNTGKEGRGTPKADTNIQLCQELQEEKNAVTRLKQEIHRFEGIVAETGELRNRWIRDVRAIESVRMKLSAAHHRIPRVESIAAKLDRIGRLNEVMHSTASYLSSGKRWVLDQLSGKSRDDNADFDDAQSSQQFVMSNSRGDLQGNSLSSRRKNSQENSQAKDVDTVPRQGGQEVGPQLDFSYHKVTVLNPAMDFKSPSPPPSIEQEQERRRVALKPR